LSMWMFKHKTSKVSFQFWFAVAVILQVLVIAGVWWVVKDDVTLTIPHNAENTITLTTEYNGPIKAPITAGQEIGVLKVTIPGQPDTSHPIFAANAVEAKGFIAQTLYKAKALVLGQ